MKVTVKENKGLQKLMTVVVEKAEALEKKDAQLKEIRKRAEIKGFRKGMAPIGLINRIYGESAMQEAVNNLITDGINNYIKENNITLLGEPMPNEGQKQLDLEKDETFEFVYDIAFRPEVNLVLDKKDKVVKYNIKPTAEDIKKYKDDVLKQYGTLVDTEAVSDEDFLVVDLEQGEHKVEKSYITLKSLDAKAKKQFIGKKAGDSLEVDVIKTFPNDADRGSLLRMKKEEAAAIAEPLYKVTIKEVKTFKSADENQEFYDRMFGKDKVKDSAAFEAELSKRLEEEYAQQSDFRLRRDIIDFLVKKASLELPEDFLKRWLFELNRGKFTMEQIEKEFPLFIQDYTWQMISNKIFTEQKMKIEKSDLLAAAKEMTANQFAMYGMANIPDAQLTEYAQKLLEEGKEANRIYEKCEEDRVLEYVKGVITITDKDITPAELEKQMNKAK